jgi:hypothetical protein
MGRPEQSRSNLIFEPVGLVPASRHVVRKSSTDEMRVFPYLFGAERVLVNAMVCAFLGRVTAAPRRSAIPKRCDD